MTTEAGDLRPQTSFRPVAIPKIACKVRQDNSGLVSRLAALEQRIEANELHRVGSPQASGAAQAAGRRPTLAASGESSDVLTAILERLELLEQQGSTELIARIEALENPAIDPLGGLKLRITSLEECGGPAAPVATGAAPEAGDMSRAGSDVSAPLSKRQVLGIVAPLIDEVRQGVTGVNNAMTKTTGKTTKQAEHALQASSDCKKQLKAVNTQLIELKAAVAKMKPQTAVAADNSVIEDTIGDRLEKHSQQISESLTALQQRMAGLEMELGCSMGAASTTPVADVAESSVPTAPTPPIPTEPTSSRPATVPRSRPATGGGPQEDLKVDCSPGKSETTAVSDDIEVAKMSSDAASRQSTAAEGSRMTPVQHGSPLASPGVGGLGARVAAIEEACGLFVLRGDQHLVWRKELNDQIEKQKENTSSKLKELKKEIASFGNKLKRGMSNLGTPTGEGGEGGSGGGGGVDAEELASLVETVEDLKARATRSDKLGKQMLSSMESLTFDIEHKLKSKCEKEEFKTGFYRVEESLKDATKSLTIAAHERKQHNAAISEQERVLTTLKNGLESMEAAVQLGGAVTQEDLTKIRQQIAAENGAATDHIRSNLQGAESRLDAKINRMYGELGQLNKLTQLWGGMLNLGGGCCDDGNSEMSAGPSSGGLRRDQRDALSGELMDARVERLETQTRSLMEAREESMALLRSTVGDLRDTKVRVTSMRDVCSTLAPKDQLEKVKKYADSLRRQIKEKASSADLQTNNTSLKRTAEELLEAQRNLGDLSGRFEAESREHERIVDQNTDKIRVIETKLSDAKEKLEELTVRIDELPDPVMHEALGDEWSNMVAQAGGMGEPATPGSPRVRKGSNGGGGSMSEESRLMLETHAQQLKVITEIDQRNFEKFTMWLTKHDKNLSGLKDKVNSQNQHIEMALLQAGATQAQQTSSLVTKVDRCSQDMSTMRKQHMALSFTVSMDRKVTGRREERLLEFEQQMRGSLNTCVQAPVFESHVAEVMSLKADAAEVKTLKTEVDEQLESLLDKSRAAEMVQELVDRLEPQMKFRAREVQPGYHGNTLGQHIAVLLDAMSVQSKKLSDVSTGVARISAQQREVSADKLMELVQDGIEVALTGLADKVYNCVSISQKTEQLSQDLCAAVLAMGLDPKEEAKLLRCSQGQVSSSLSTGAHKSVLQALYKKPAASDKQGGTFSTHQAKVDLLEQRKRLMVKGDDDVTNQDWLRMLNSSPELDEPASPQSQLVGGALVRKLAAIQQEPKAAKADKSARNAPIQYKADSSEVAAVAQRTKDLLVASDGAIEDLWQSVESIENRIANFATADIISHKVDRGELLHLLDEIVQAYERKLTGNEGDSLLAMSKPGSDDHPNCALCSKPLNAFHAAVGDCVRHGKFPPRLPIRQEKTPQRQDRVELKTASGGRIVLPKDIYDRQKYAADVEISARKPSPRRGDRPSPRRGLATRQHQLQQTYGQNLEQTGDYKEELPTIIQAHTHR